MWLRQTRMWERTLLVMSGDNGGPIYWIANPAYPHGGAANNCATPPFPAPSHPHALNSWPQLMASLIRAGSIALAATVLISSRIAF